MPDLSPAESVELAALENEMADSKGALSPHWRDHYYANPAKQERAKELYAKQGNPVVEDDLGPPRGTDDRVREIMQHPDYWKSKELQEQARDILEGPTAEARQDFVPADQAAVHGEMLANWSKSFDVTTEQMSDAFERNAKFVELVGDTTDIDHVFIGLRDGVQRLYWQLLLERDPQKRTAMVNALGDEDYDQAQAFWEGMTEQEQDAFRQCLRW